MADEVSRSWDREKLVEYIRSYHVPGFLAGVTLILLLVVLHRGLQSTLAISLFAEELFSPFRTCLIGLGTGYYLGESVDDKHSSIVAFHVGAFSTLLILSLLAIGLLGNSVYILIISVLFAFFMNVSDLIDHNAIKRNFDAVARDGSRALLVVITGLQYAVSIWKWSETQLSSLGLLEKAIVGAAVIGITYLAYAITTAVNTMAGESTNT